MVNDKNKARIIGGVFLLIVVILVVVFYSTSLEQNKYCVESDATGNVMCLTDEQEIGSFALVGNFKESYAPGERLRFAEDIYYYESQYPFTNSYVYLFEVVNGQEVQRDSWRITDALNSAIADPGYTDYPGAVGGELLRSYVYNAVTVNVPSQAGDYVYKDSIRDRNGLWLDDSSLISKRGFSVLNSVSIKVVDDTQVVCEPYEGNWEEDYSVDNGNVYKREYGEICNGDLEVSRVLWKTTCDSGYFAVGTTSQVSDEKTTCEAEPVDDDPVDDDPVDDDPVDDEPVDDDSTGEEPATGDDDTTEPEVERTFWQKIGDFFVMIWESIVGVFSN